MNVIEKRQDWIDVPEHPGVPGLVFRGFQGEPDYPKMLAAIDGSKQADGIERSDTLEDIRRNYSHLVNSDPYQDMIFAEVEGEVVGYGRVEWHLDAEGKWLGFHLAFLLPEWRRMGIGRAILKHQERRLSRILAEQRAAGSLPADAPAYFDSFAFDTEVGKDVLFRQEGYLPVRYEFHMLRPFDEPIQDHPLPPGLEVRPALPEQYRAIWDASQEAFRDHWGYIPAEEEDYQGWLESPEFAPPLLQVAWDGDQVAGMVLNFVNEEENREYGRRRGYTEGISVRRPWRRLGLARALLTRSLQMFRDMGMQEAALGVDSQNLSGALRLYESVGFRQVKQMAFYRKSAEE